MTRRLLRDVYARNGKLKVACPLHGNQALTSPERPIPALKRPGGDWQPCPWCLKAHKAAQDAQIPLALPPPKGEA